VSAHEFLMIRADANVEIATGHGMRCLALAQGWRDQGGEVAFVMADSTPAIEKRLKAEEIRIERIDAKPGSGKDMELTRSLAVERSAAWIVVDGYHFGADYQQCLKAAGQRVLFVDDYGHAVHYSADLILNQNAHADETLYRHRADNTQLLLGPQYALLRREFARWREWKREIAAIGNRLLITFGGSDPDNFTPRVLHAMESPSLDGLEAAVVVGGNNPHLKSLEKAVDGRADRLRLIQDSSNMPELMAWADCAVAAAGATCWEMCFLGLPALLVDLAPNQLPTARRLNELGAGFYLGNAKDVSSSLILETLQWLLTSADRRVEMSVVGRKLVDGLGVSRVIRAMCN
jgi:UDP-2,4-diacetamido-2,4,6-trideoxy-beta-L-altropyranose hydrolase